MFWGVQDIGSQFELSSESQNSLIHHQILWLDPAYHALSFSGAFNGGDFSSQSLCTFTQCLSCFFSSSLLYSFLQAGRFTTKRQRESPINLVANHALDSSVDLCLCPSVCICSFIFPLTHFHILFIYLPLSPIKLFFICVEYSGYFISPSLQVFSPDIHPLFIPTTHTSQQP